MIETTNIQKTEDIRIISTKIEFQDKLGRMIKGYLDRKNDKRDMPIVVISPGYGEITRDYVSTAYYLAYNNFTVIRYDCPNHIGESEGGIINFRLSDIENGLMAAINYAYKNFGKSEIGLIASSLSGRVAFKIANREKRIKYLLALTSVIDLKSTLSSLYKEDLIGEYKKGKRWGTLDILGFEVKDDFLDEVIKDNYADLNSTICDIENIKIPVSYLVAENDAWVKYKDIKMVYEHTHNKESKLIKISGALHQIQENPRLAKIAILKILRACLIYAKQKDKSLRKVSQPPIHYIVQQNKVEINTLKNIFTVKKSDEKKFWVEYLSKYLILIKSKDYQNLLSLIAQLFGGIKNGDRILDAGCGNGHFGAWLLCNMDILFKRTNSFFSYAGIDFAESALEDARRIHADLIRKLFPGDTTNKWLNNFTYSLVDLEENLPMQDEYFDKICCNLVISYLKMPSSALKKLYLKLNKGGRIVISSLKPYNDLSLIYKDYLDQNPSEEEISEGRKLLSSAGKIRHKEKYGHYHFYDERELEEIMKLAGFNYIKVYRGFGNQANIAVAEKL